MLTGLILAGGKSSRMGKDKALIDDNGEPHVFHLAKLLEPCCTKILISRNKDQKILPENNYEIIFDDESSENQGPLTGLISAIEKYPDENFLVMYCDLYSINENTIEKLVNGRDKEKYATCFLINDFPEPSFAIIENKSNPILLNKYKSGKYSIIKFLKEFDCKQITHDEKIIDKDE
jgi:molybdopterin-guanine dinucleotide biosynthesis protein A